MQEEVNNTEQVIYHCQLASFIWDIVRDLMRILVRTKKIIDVRAALINYYTLENCIENKKSRKYFKTLILIARKVIYTLYYKEDQLSRII